MSQQHLINDVLPSRFVSAGSSHSIHVEAIVPTRNVLFPEERLVFQVELSAKYNALRSIFYWQNDGSFPFFPDKAANPDQVRYLESRPASRHLFRAQQYFPTGLYRFQELILTFSYHHGFAQVRADKLS